MSVDITGMKQVVIARAPDIVTFVAVIQHVQGCLCFYLQWGYPCHGIEIRIELHSTSRFSYHLDSDTEGSE